ncbi:MAG: hypothetical protein Fur0010_22990 [Bdellovibrio sp.]
MNSLLAPVKGTATITANATVEQIAIAISSPNTRESVATLMTSKINLKLMMNSIINWSTSMGMKIN